MLGLNKNMKKGVKTVSQALKGIDPYAKNDINKESIAKAMSELKSMKWNDVTDIDDIVLSVGEKYGLSSDDYDVLNGELEAFFMDSGLYGKRK